MSQTKAQSMFEVVASVVIGYCVAVVSQLLILPIFGIYVSFTENLAIAAWFTVVSIVRGYFVRRYFNWRHA